MFKGLSDWLGKTFFRHKHHARPIRVQHTKLPMGLGLMGGGGGEGVESTVVLYTCTECGSAETHTLLGTWSLDEVQGKVGTVADSVDSLLRTSTAGGAR